MTSRNDSRLLDPRTLLNLRTGSSGELLRFHTTLKDDHRVLEDTLTRWAKLSAINGNRRYIDAELKRIVKENRSSSTDSDTDLFDHLIRRADSNERTRLSALVSKRKADLGWLDAIMAASQQERGESSLWRYRAR